MKNEAGKAIDEKKKKPEIYKKWMKKTHLKIQKAGEVEDPRTVKSVSKSAYE